MQYLCRTHNKITKLANKENDVFKCKRIHEIWGGKTNDCGCENKPNYFQNLKKKSNLK